MSIHYKICFLCFAHCLLLTSCATHFRNSTTNNFAGMWKLEKVEFLDSTTNHWEEDRSKIGYIGYIIYDGMGHMGVQIVSPDYKEFKINKSVDSLDNNELKKLVKFYSTPQVYFANCRISTNVNIIEHHKLSSIRPNEWGTTVKRVFEFKKDTLILTPQEKINGIQSRLRWVKE